MTYIYIFFFDFQCLWLIWLVNSFELFLCFQGRRWQLSLAYCHPEPTLSDHFVVTCPPQSHPVLEESTRVQPICSSYDDQKQQGSPGHLEPRANSSRTGNISFFFFLIASSLKYLNWSNFLLPPGEPSALVVTTNLRSFPSNDAMSSLHWLDT